MRHRYRMVPLNEAGERPTQEPDRQYGRPTVEALQAKYAAEGALVNPARMSSLLRVSDEAKHALIRKLRFSMSGDVICARFKISREALAKICKCGTYSRARTIENDADEWFVNIYEAADAYGVSPSCVRNSIIGAQRTAAGRRWKYSGYRTREAFLASRPSPAPLPTGPAEEE
jgi:hypothetical protein